MNSVGFLFSWYNLPFTLALATSIVLALIQLAGGGDNETDGAGDGDAALDLDGDSLGAEPQHNVQTAGPLAALGVGRLPLLLVLIALLGSLGAVGLVCNVLLVTVVNPYPGVAFVPVLLASLLVALPLTRVISVGLARLAPRTSTAIRHEDLVGRAGTVVSATVSKTYGRIAVRDRHGTVHTVFAIVEQDEPLLEHSEVAVLRYNPQQRQFVVRKLR